MAKKTRVQVDFTQEDMEKLNKVMKTTNAGSRTEAVKRALSFLLLLEEAKKQGYQIMIETENGKIIKEFVY